MKNSYQEHLKRSAKTFHRNNRSERFTNGIIIHQYDDADVAKPSWWDDVSFILNNYLVEVSWIHPRMAFKDQAEAEAHNRVAYLDSGIDDFLSQTKPNYAKVGKSRKKIISYTSSGPLISSDWSAAFNAANAEVIKTAEFQIKPFIKIEWMLHARSIELCAPIEVRSALDLIVLVNLVRKLLKHETTLEQEFPNYVYTKDNWIAEDKKQLVERVFDGYK